MTQTILTIYILVHFLLQSMYVDGEYFIYKHYI